MLLQITKYLFKYLQNSYLAEDVVFMKNWDILTPEFKAEEEISTLYELFPRDSELILYISFVCQLKINDLQAKFKLSEPEELISILKSLLYKTLNNNLNLTKIYKPVWEKAKLEGFFKNIELKNVHSSELMKNLIEIKQNPKAFLACPDSFFRKVNYKFQYNSPPYNSPIKSPIPKISRYYSENPAHPNEFNTAEGDKPKFPTHERHNNHSKSRSRSRSRVFKSFKSFGDLHDESANIEELRQCDHPPVESFVKTQDYFISALNDCKGSYQGSASRGLKIKEQVDEDNKAIDEKRNQGAVDPVGKKSHEKQPQHRSVLQRINNEKADEKRSESSESEEDSHHHKHKKGGSNDSKSRKSKKIAKKHAVGNTVAVAKKKNPREEFEKYLVGDLSRSGTSGGHYERQLLKKYKGEKLAEFIEKVSGGKSSREYPSYGSLLSDYES